MINLIGQSIGRYHITERLGEGGMATVYKAYDTRLETDVAFKVIRKDALGRDTDDRLLKRFDREAKSLARLNHTNIVKVIDYGEFEGLPYLVMPYLPGGTLKQFMGRPIGYAEAARMLAPICRALEYAHQQGMVHRDVKPANILVTESGDLVLTDFGIAMLLEVEETAQLTGTGLGLGTPEYMAPEQWLGKAGPASDQYGLGVVFYELVTGRKPYAAETPAAILLKQANDPLPRPRLFVKNIPEPVEKVLFKTLAKKPEDRYPDMREFAVAMEKLAQGAAETRFTAAASAEQHTQAAKPTPADDTFDEGLPAGTGETVKGKKKGQNFLHSPWKWVAGGLVVVPLAAVLLFALNPPRPVTQPAPATATVSTAVSAAQNTAAPSPMSTTTQIEAPAATPKGGAIATQLTANATQKAVKLNEHEEQLQEQCGVEPIQAILSDYSIEFYNNFSSGLSGIERWDANLQVSDGILLATGHGDWKGAGRSDKMHPGKAYLIRFRGSSKSYFHIYLEQSSYGTAGHRVWGFLINNGLFVPEVYIGAQYSSVSTDWQQNDLSWTTGWICALLTIDDNTFTTKVWNPVEPQQISIVSKEMGGNWANFFGTSGFAVETGTLEVDVFSELLKKK